MAIGLTNTMKEARGLATADRIDAAATPGKLYLYNGTRPATGGAPPNPALAVITLQDPCGTVGANGTLTITPPAAAAQVLVSGAPTWGRFTDGDDVAVIDADAGTAGTDIILDQENVYAGAFVSLISAVFTEGG